MHFQEGPYPPLSLCRFTPISGMVLGFGKNLKLDNYLKIFIPEKWIGWLASVVFFNIYYGLGTLVPCRCKHSKSLGLSSWPNVIMGRSGCNIIGWDMLDLFHFSFLFFSFFLFSFFYLYFSCEWSLAGMSRNAGENDYMTISFNNLFKVRGP